MEWILNNLQILFLVAIAVTAILQRLKKAHEGEEAPRTAPATPGDDERTRRIQEEIRRRIMERRGLAPAAPQSGDDREGPRPFPAAPPMIEEVRPVRVEAPPVVAAADAKIAAELKRQQEIVERIRQLETAKRSRVAAVSPGSVSTAVAEPADRSLPDLQSRSGLRRAIMLREILGPPVGLR
jgi:hypothetical protein